MFFMRRRHHHGLLHLILALLGFGFLTRRTGCCRHHDDEGAQSERRAKLNLFRSKLRDAFKVWEDEGESAAKAEPAQPAEEAQA